MLLIYPPCAKACEAPSGIAKLAGTLKANDIPCVILDANLEGQLFLLESSSPPVDTWGRRAYKNLSANLRDVRNIKLYKNNDRYQRTVTDINKILDHSGKEKNISLTLSNYMDSTISPTQSSDLLRAAKSYESNIFYPYFSKRLPALLEDYAISSVGFSLTYLSQAICTFAMVGFIKKQYPHIPIILGGGLVTSWTSNTSWKNPFKEIVDHLIAGPGEEPLLNLLAARKKITYGLPDYTDLPQDQYLSPVFILPYAASSGCYWKKCNFCPENAEGNPYKKTEPDKVLQEISTLRSQTNPSLIHFLDNAMSPDLLGAIVNKPFDIPWYGFVRVSFQLTDEEFCTNLKKSGCCMLKIGLESGSQKVLDSMDKGIDLKTMSKALAALEKAGISTYVYLLFGTPEESLEEARETLAYVVAHSGAITFLNLAIFNMPICKKGSAAIETRDFYDGDLSLYTDFIHTRGWAESRYGSFWMMNLNAIRL